MDSPYIYKFKNKKRKENNIKEKKTIQQNKFSFPDYNIIIDLIENNSLSIICEYKQNFYQKILTLKELIELSEILKAFNDVKEIYSIFLDIIKDNKIFVVQFNDNQIKFNMLLNQKNNKIQPIEIPLLRIEKILKKDNNENNNGIVERKISNNNICSDNDFILVQNNTYDENVDSVILGFVNNLNSHIQAKKITNKDNKTDTNTNSNSNKNKKKTKKNVKH